MNCCPNILISIPENCLEEFGLLLPISHDRVLILWFHPKSLVSPETFWWSCSDFMITPKITGLTWNCQSHPRTFETYWPPCPTIKEIHDHTLNIPYLDPLTEIAWLSCIVKNPPQVWSSQARTSQFRATISGHGMHLPSSRICTSVDPKSWMSPQIPDEPPNLGGGTWLGLSVLENETHEHKILTSLFTSAEQHRYSVHTMKKRPSLFIPNAGDVPVPFPFVRSGSTFFCWLIQDKLLMGEEGKRRGVTGRRFSWNWNKMELPRFPLIEKDIRLLSILWRSSVEKHILSGSK